MSPATRDRSLTFSRRAPVRKPLWARPSLLALESRITPATATLLAGVLTVDYTATGATPESVTFTNDGANITLSGDISGSTINAVASVSKIIVQDSGGSTDQGVTFAGTANYLLSNGFSSSAVEAVTVSRAIGVTGTNTLSITTSKNIMVSGASSGLSTVNGDLTLKANQQITPTSGKFSGIEIDNATLSSTTGAVLLQGRGGNDSIGSLYGVKIYNGAQVGAGTSGTVTVTGQGGISDRNFNAGVLIASGGKIVSGGGSLIVTGQGGGIGPSGANFGVQLTNAGEVIAGGSGIVTVTGTGGHGSLCAGVSVSGTGSKISSINGAVSVTGNGGANGNGNAGVYVWSEGQITAGGLQSVTIQGNGGLTAGSANHGVHVTDSATIDSSGGSVSITAVGNATSEGLHINNSGTVASGGSALLTIGTDSLRITGATAKIRGGATGTDKIYIRPQTIATIIDFGGADNMTVFPYTLGITDAELDRVFAGKLEFGNVSTGVIKTSALITRPANTEMTLTSGVSMSFTAGLDSAGGAISLVSYGKIDQTAGTIQASGGTLTVNAINQIATFNSIGNKAAQLVISANSTTQVNGSFDASGAVQVDGNLSGTGTVGTVTVMSTGKIAPGASPGKLTTGNVVFNSSSELVVDLNGTTAGTDYDQLAVNGTVNLGGANLAATLNFLPSSNNVFRIIDNDGSDMIGGTFNGYAEGAKIPIGGIDFIISYKGGDGNDVTLTTPVFPTVTSVVFGDGTNQRSMVKQMVVTFSEAVTFAGDVTAAMTLARSNSSTQPGPLGNVTLSSTPASGSATAVTITFSGPKTLNGSLIDGYYNFTIDADLVTTVNGKLDGGSGTGTDYVRIGTTANKYFRLFGDGNGSGVTDLGDFAAFRNAFNLGPNSIFDFGEGDNNVGLADFAQFRGRFNLTP